MLSPNVQIINQLELERLRINLLNSAPPTQSISLDPKLNIINDSNEYSGGIIRGISYPLEISNGGLKVSANSDRIYEQVREIIETRIGERIMRQFFGTPDLIFQSFSEDILRNNLTKQIEESLPVEIDTDIDISLSDNGTAVIYINWSLNGRSDYQRMRFEIDYNF